MDMYKDAVVNELRQMMTAWTGTQQNPNTKDQKIRIERMRRKIIKLCDILDQLDKIV